MPALFSNNASATLASSISTSSTSITVSTGMGALFPTITAGTYFYATLTDSSNNLEIIKVTGRTSDSLTVVRAQEGTTARAYAAADKVELRITAAVLGNFVQLDGAQTITGVKTFSGANAYGTPASITLTNATGLPVATGISGLGTGVATFLATPSSANLASAVTDETGSGALVFATGPTLVTPALGTPSSGTLTNCTFPTVPASASVSTTNFTIQESGGYLVFKYGATTIASMDSSGNIITVGEVTAGGTP
jgi:hypothetical protein